MKQAQYHFRLLWLASLISAVGSGMTSFVLGIYVYQKTGLSSWTGLLMLLGFLPGLLLSPLAGILADRYDRRLLMMLGDGLSIIGLLTILFAIHFLAIDTSLIWIGLGVAISSTFSALVEPAFRATISDLLDKEAYSQASGMVQIVSSARYLISPILATFVLSILNTQAVILFDIATILLTLPVTYLVRQHMQQKATPQHTPFKAEMSQGFRLIYQQKGVWLLVIFGIWVSFYIGTIQTLMTPMILGFSTESFLGFATTFSACGMLASGFYLSTKKINKPHATILRNALIAVGLAMILFASFQNQLAICFFGFGLFAALPFANMAIDYLVRINTPQAHQGKVWGFIGFISQMGYILAYASVGLVNDYLMTPLMAQTGLLGSTLGKLIGTGPGRGAATLIILAGLLLILTTSLLTKRPEIKSLEDGEVVETA